MGSYPLSALPFDIGFILLALALFRYAGILGLLLKMLRKPRIDVLLYVAAVSLLLSVGVHVYASATLISKLGSADAASFDVIYTQAMFFRNLSLSCLVLSGVLSAAIGWIYYRWISR